MLTKKGVSEIIVTILIVLLALVVIIIVWQVVVPMIQSTSSNIGTSAVTMNLEIKNAYVNYTTNWSQIIIKRNVGVGNLSGIKFIFENSTDSWIHEEDTSLEELQEQSYYIYFGTNITGDITKVSIAPIVQTPSGKLIMGPVKDSAEKSKGEIVEGVVNVPLSCVSHSYTKCYNSIDVWWYNSCDQAEEWNKTCSSGEICSNGQCVSQDTQAPKVYLDPQNSYSSYNITSINFNCSATDDLALKNITLYGNWSGLFGPIANASISGVSNSSIFPLIISSPGNYIWNCYACDNSGNCSFNSANNSLTILGAFPITSCGTTLNQANTIYTMTQSTSSDSTCFNITGKNATLDCAGYTISYAKNTKGYGVSIMNISVKVKNCIINMTNQTSLVTGAYGIYSGTTAYGNATIYNNTIITNGDLNTISQDNEGIYLSTSPYWNITGNRITTNAKYSYGIIISGGAALGTYISGNNITTMGSAESYVLYMNGATKNTIIGNNFYSPYNYLIRIVSGTNNNFYNNYLNSTGTAVIRIEGTSSNYTFLNNIIMFPAYGSNTIYYFYSGNAMNISSTNDIITKHTATNISRFGTANASFIITNMSVANSSGYPANLSNSFSWGTTGIANVTVKWYLDVNVTSNGNPLQDAVVTAKDKNGLIVFGPINTLSTGKIPQQILAEFFQNKTDTITYSDYNISVVKPSYNENSSLVTLNASKQIDIILQSAG
jgi:hypothetical protein